MGIRETFLGVIDTGRISVPTVLDGVLGRISPERVDERLRWWAHKIVDDAQMHLEVRGREHAEGDEPFIVMSNHQSLHDIPVLYCALPGRIRMVAKAELFRVPIWGRAMLAAGFVRVERANRGRAIQSLRDGASMLRDGTRLWIAPEGTRSHDGRLGPFKSGGFHLALDTNTRILPVVIDGTRHTLPANSARVRLGQSTTVTVLPPVDPRAYGKERRRELIAEVRSVIEATLTRPSARTAT